ncbi:remodeling and spacing factor 1-like isoform X2, partial [Leptotrombidium deliense]
MLEENDNICEELIDLHIRLLRKRRKYINKEKWEKALVKFIAEYSNVEAWELERYGYKRVKLGIRLNALKHLMEAQFDFNPKFKGEVNAMESMSLRLLPIGRDVRGNQYWFQCDLDFNFRVYKEEPDEEKSWVMICKYEIKLRELFYIPCILFFRDKHELCKLITDLEAGNTHVLKEESSATVSENDDSNLTNVKELPLKENVQTCKCESTNNNTNDMLNIRVKLEAEDDLTPVNNVNPIKVNGELSESEQFCKSGCNIKNEHEESQSSSINGDDSLKVDKKLDSLKPEIEIKEDIDKEDNEQFELTSVDIDFNYNDVVNLMNDLLDKVDELIVTKSCDAELKHDDDDVIVKEVCNYLLDSVCNNECSAKETSLNEIVRVCRGGSRGRGRPRGRGGLRSRGRSARSAPKAVEETETVERDLSPLPIKRSLRIQALQEKKNAELAEQMKREQQRIEDIAKKRTEQKKNSELKNRKAEK